MTTTTSTTAASAATTQSATAAATQSLLTSLGSGSGIDTSSLVGSLVEAQFAARTARLAKQTETLTAQISGVTTVKSAISGFATALDTLAKSGTLATQPTSSNTAVLTATAKGGASLSGLSANITVDRLASAQVATTGAIAGATTRATALGSGQFTIELGRASYSAATPPAIDDFDPAEGPGASVSFALTDASVDSIAAAINDKARALGVTATVVTGADGASYLSLKGRTGADSAFRITVDGDAALDQFAVGQGAATRIATTAANAQLTVDGIAVERGSNTVDDLLSGVSLQLAATGAARLTATRPTAALTQAVADLVDTYNQVAAIVAEQTDPVDGQLARDPAARTLLQNLRKLTLTGLGAAGAGAPRTLAEIGVRTARDGTLSVDDAQLSAALSAHPDVVEAMFASSSASATGLPAALNALSKNATGATYGLGASTARYTAQQLDVADQQAKIAAEAETLRTRMTQQFSSMNSRITAYKSTQSFLDNQIKAWNRSDD